MEWHRGWCVGGDGEGRVPTSPLPSPPSCDSPTVAARTVCNRFWCFTRSLSACRKSCCQRSSPPPPAPPSFLPPAAPHPSPNLRPPPPAWADMMLRGGWSTSEIRPLEETPAPLPTPGSGRGVRGGMPSLGGIGCGLGCGFTHLRHSSAVSVSSAWGGGGCEAWVGTLGGVGGEGAVNCSTSCS